MKGNKEKQIRDEEMKILIKKKRCEEKQTEIDIEKIDSIDS